MRRRARAPWTGLAGALLLLFGGAELPLPTPGGGKLVAQLPTALEAAPRPASPAAPLAPVLPWSSTGRASLDARAFADPASAGGEASATQPLDAPGVTPRGAFLRSLVLPGWGHVAAGAHGRAAFYVAAQGGSGWMLAKSLERRRSAARFREAEFRLVSDEIRAAGVTRPDSVRLLALDDPRVERWDELVDIRSDQVEDWVALSVFLALLGATDALVAAHMADTPEPLSIRLLPEGRGGGWSLRLSLPWGPRGRGGP
jgi:hypothetical protein